MALKDKIKKTKTPRVLVIGPDSEAIGGIAGVISCYKRNFAGMKFGRSNSRKGTLAGFLNLGILFIMLPVYRACGYNIIHAHGGSGKSFFRKNILLRVSDFWGFKTVYHCHGGLFKDYAIKKGVDSISRKLQKFSTVVVLTEKWKTYFNYELGCRHVKVINNPVEAPVIEVNRKHVTSGTLRFLYMGKICKEKGVFDLLEVLEANINKFSSTICVDVAGFGDVDKLRQEISRRGLGSFVNYLGAVKGAEKDRVLRDSDVMLLPSYAEGVPLTLLEAGVYGMPSITTDVGGIPEIIKDGYNGMLFMPGDKDALAKAITYYIYNPDEVLKQGANARCAVKEYEIENVERQLNILYKELLEN